MAAVWMRARAEMRRGWRALLGLALLVGLAGGAVLGAAMGARRTQTAYPRFVEASNAHDVLLSGGSSESLRSGFYEAAAALLEVEASGLGAGIGLVAPGGEDLSRAFAVGFTFAALDEDVGTRIDRPKVLEGRLPDPTATDEAVVNKVFADATGIGPGDRFEVRQGTDRGPIGPKFTIEVVGVAVTATEVIPVANLDELPLMSVPEGVTRAHIVLDERGFEGMFLTLHPGIDVAAFERRIRALADDYPRFGELFFASEAGRPAVVARALRPQVLALAAFAIFAGITMLLVSGQTLARQVRLDAVENPTLSALGMSRVQLFVAGLVRATAVAVVGGLIAVALAVAASPLTPIGPARLAEPSPGLAANAAMLAIGFGIIVLALVAATAYPAWRAARTAQAPAPNRPSAIAAFFARAGTRPSATVGVRMALEPGRGRTAVPVRTTLAGSVIALATVAAAFTFGASLHRLVATPRLYGQDWNILSDTQFGAVPPSLVRLVRTDPSVEAAAGGVYGLINLGGEVVPAIGLDLLRGTAFPTLLQGRPPQTPDEIVLGASSLRRLGARIGDQVDAGGRRMRVVGTAVFPRLGQGSFTPTALGEGAAVITEAMPGTGVPPGRYTYLLIRTNGEPSAALAKGLADLCALVSAQQNVCAPSQRPADIENYAKMRATPYVLSGLLAALALATLAHGLVTSVARRRRDLAVLKTLGFERGQVSGAVAWQATTLTGLALVVGMPLGIAAGHWGWKAFAGQLGVFPESVTPLATILVAGGVALLLANLIAALPARSAARTQPAVVLRSE